MEHVLIVFMVHHMLRDDERLIVVGSDPALGMWDVSRGLSMTNAPLGSAQWVGVARLPPGKTEFKLVVVSEDGRVCWEGEVNNKVIDLITGTRQALVKTQFNQQELAVELTKEPEVTANMEYLPGVARLRLPYWRHSLTNLFKFVKMTSDGSDSRECQYLSQEGAAVVDVAIPEDLILRGYFQVCNDNGDVINQSDERTISFQTKAQAYGITFPYSSLENYMVNDIKCTILPKDTVQPTDNVGMTASTHNAVMAVSTDNIVIPVSVDEAVTAVSTIDNLMAVQTSDVLLPVSADCDKCLVSVQGNKKKKGFRGLFRRLRRFLKGKR